MTTIAPDTEKLRELDDQERRAWSDYNERLRDLTGLEYELAEAVSWDELQRELQGLRERRRSLEQSVP